MFPAFINPKIHSVACTSWYIQVVKDKNALLNISVKIREKEKG